MQHSVGESSEESRKSFLAAFSLDGTSITRNEQNRILDEYRAGLSKISRTLELEGMSLENFETVVRDTIAVCFEGWPGIKKPEVRARLAKEGSESSSIINRAIDLALRMWLMIDCCVDTRTLYPKTWSDEEGIEDFIRNRFDMVDDDDDAEPIARFPRRFRAVELERVGGITVQWTSFLDEHLRFAEDTREVKIFNNKALLSTLLKKAGTLTGPTTTNSAHSHNSRAGNRETTKISPRKHAGLPSELLNETLMTLDVLFPPWHKPTVQFLESQGQDFHLIPPFPRDVPKPRDFKCWRYRLIDLIAEYEAPPLDWKHIWRDRRNPAAFWTFWIGMAIFIFTMIFGIIASLLAGLQVKLAHDALTMVASPCLSGTGG